MNRVIALATAATLSVGAAQAATISDSAMIISTKTDWEDSVALNQFDTALGVLNSVTLTVVGRVDGNASFDNGSNNPTEVIANLSAEIEATGPGASFTIIVEPIGSRTVSLGADEGELGGIPDFAGTDSASITGVTGTDTDTVTLNSGFGAYLGTGTFLVDFDADATSNVSGTGNVAAFFETFASAEVSVVYDYTAAPVPLPAGLPLLLAGLGGLAYLKRRTS